MIAIKNFFWFKTICVVLIAAFLSLDVAWAYPNDPTIQNQNLAAQSLLQQTVMTGQAAALQKTLFSDIKANTSIDSVWKYLIADRLPLNFMEESLIKHCLESGTTGFYEGMDLSKVRGAVFENGRLTALPVDAAIEQDKAVILIPYVRDGKEYVIQLASRNLAAGYALGALKWNEAPQFDFARRVVPKSASEPQPAAPAAEPQVSKPAAPAKPSKASGAIKRIFIITAMLFFGSMAISNTAFSQDSQLDSPLFYKLKKNGELQEWAPGYKDPGTLVRDYFWYPIQEPTLGDVVLATGVAARFREKGKGETCGSIADAIARTKNVLPACLAMIKGSETFDSYQCETIVYILSRNRDEKNAAIILGEAVMSENKNFEGPALEALENKGDPGIVVIAGLIKATSDRKQKKRYVQSLIKTKIQLKNELLRDVVPDIKDLWHEIETSVLLSECKKSGMSQNQKDRLMEGLRQLPASEAVNLIVGQLRKAEWDSQEFLVDGLYAIGGMEALARLRDEVLLDPKNDYDAYFQPDNRFALVGARAIEKIYGQKGASFVAELFSEYSKAGTPLARMKQIINAMRFFKKEEAEPVLTRIVESKDNLELRKTAIKVLAAHFQSERVENYLVKLGESNETLELRAAAIESLHYFKNDRIKPFLIQVLRSSNDTALRKKVLEILTYYFTPDQKTIDTLKWLAREEKDSELRNAAIDKLEKGRDESWFVLKYYRWKSVIHWLLGISGIAAILLVVKKLFLRKAPESSSKAEKKSADKPKKRRGGFTTLLSVNPFAGFFIAAAAAPKTGFGKIVDDIDDFFGSDPIGCAILFGAIFIMWELFSLLAKKQEFSAVKFGTFKDIWLWTEWDAGTGVIRHLKERIIAVGKPVVPLLLPKLGSDNPDIRRTAAEMLGKIEGGESVYALIYASLEDKDETVRAAAKEALAQKKWTGPEIDAEVKKPEYIKYAKSYDEPPAKKGSILPYIALFGVFVAVAWLGFSHGWIAPDKMMPRLKGAGMALGTIAVLYGGLTVFKALWRSLVLSRYSSRSASGSISSLKRMMRPIENINKRLGRLGDEQKKKEAFKPRLQICVGRYSMLVSTNPMSRLLDLDDQTMEEVTSAMERGEDMTDIFTRARRGQSRQTFEAPVSPEEPIQDVLARFQRIYSMDYGRTFLKQLFTENPDFKIMLDEISRINEFIGSELKDIEGTLKSYDLISLKRILKGVVDKGNDTDAALLSKAFEAVQLISDFKKKGLDALFDKREKKFWLMIAEDPDLEEYNAAVLEGMGRMKFGNDASAKKKALVEFLGKVANNATSLTVYERQAAVTALRQLGGRDSEEVIAKVFEDPLMVQREVRIPKDCDRAKAVQKIVGGIEWVIGRNELSKRYPDIERKINNLFDRKPEILDFIKNYPLRLFSIRDRQKMGGIILGDFRRYWFQVIGIIHLRHMGGLAALGSNAWQEIGRTMEIMSKDSPIDMGMGIELFRNEQLLASVFHHEWLHSTGIMSEGETLLMQANYTKALVAGDALPLTEEKRVELESDIADTMSELGITPLGYYFVADLDDQYLSRLNRHILAVYGRDDLTEEEIEKEAGRVLAEINGMIERRNRELREQQQYNPRITLFSPLSEENEKRVIELVKKTRQIKNTLTAKRFREIIEEDLKYLRKWEEYQKADGGRAMKVAFDRKESAGSSDASAMIRITVLTGQIVAGSPGAELYMQRGEAYANLDKFSKALDDFSRAIKLNPEYSEAYIARSVMHAVTGNLEMAKHDLIKALRINRALKSQARDIAARFKLNLDDIEIGIGTAAIIEDYLKDLGSDKKDTVERAIEGLAKIGQPAIPPLIKALKEKREKAGSLVQAILIKIGPPAIPDLIKLLRDRDKFLRDAAAGMLKMIGEPAIPDLIKVLKDKNDRSPPLAANILIELGQPALPLLIEAFKDEKAASRFIVSQVLVLIGKEAMGPLTELLKDKDEGVRKAAADAIEEIKKKKTPPAGPASHGSTALLSINPFAVVLGLGAASPLLDAARDSFLLNPWLTAFGGLAVVIAAFYTAWMLSNRNAPIRLSAVQASGGTERYHPAEPLMTAAVPPKNEEARGGPLEGPAGAGPGIRGTPPPVIDKEVAQKVKELFEIVEGTINNRRAQFVIDANSAIAQLNDVAGMAGKFNDVAFDKMMLTSQIKANAKELFKRVGELKDVNLTEELVKKINGLKEAIVSVETDSVIASIIAASRKVKDGEKIIIGLETDWIPGMDEKGYGTQHDAMTPLVREIENIGSHLKALGLGNIEIIHTTANELKDAVLSRAQETNTHMSNIIILGSSATIGPLIEENVFMRRSAQGVEERAFLAEVDTTNIMKAYAEAINRTNGCIDLDLIELVSIALELSLGKEPPKIPIIYDYDSKNRVVILQPMAKAVDYEAMKNEYEAQRTALRSV